MVLFLFIVIVSEAIIIYHIVDKLKCYYVGSIINPITNNTEGREIS